MGLEREDRSKNTYTCLRRRQVITSALLEADVIGKDPNDTHYAQHVPRNSMNTVELSYWFSDTSLGESVENKNILHQTSQESLEDSLVFFYIRVRKPRVSRNFTLDTNGKFFYIHVNHVRHEISLSTQRQPSTTLNLTRWQSLERFLVVVNLRTRTTTVIKLERDDKIAAPATILKRKAQI